MGLLDDAKDKVTGLLHDHEDQVKDGIDKAADAAEAKLGSEHADKIETVADKAKDALDKLID
jgi:hypothetical protein